MARMERRQLVILCGALIGLLIVESMWLAYPLLRDLVRWRRLFGRFGGSVKVYSGCRSCCQNPFESISLPLLLRLWGGGQGA